MPEASMLRLPIARIGLANDHLAVPLAEQRDERMLPAENQPAAGPEATGDPGHRRVQADGPAEREDGDGEIEMALGEPLGVLEAALDQSRGEFTGIELLPRSNQLGSRDIEPPELRCTSFGKPGQRPAIATAKLQHALSPEIAEQLQLVLWRRQGTPQRQRRRPDGRTELVPDGAIQFEMSFLHALTSREGAGAESSLRGYSVQLIETTAGDRFLWPVRGGSGRFRLFLAQRRQLDRPLQEIRHMVAEGEDRRVLIGLLLARLP